MSSEVETLGANMSRHERNEGRVQLGSIDTIVADIAEETRTHTHRGKVADYIPPLACVPDSKFGIAVVLHDGSVHTAGDAEEPFSIQSISKVFALTLALGAVGDQLWRRVGREPSGTAFNSIVQLETEHGIPRNPFINAGAIVVCDVLLARGDRADAALCPYGGR